jgi:3-hydroxyacyl-CoA dehydrogenase
MVNEGARVLEKSIAQGRAISMYATSPVTASRNGGGPMYYADMVGLRNVYEDIERFHAKHGYWWEPAPPLRSQKDGKRFADL